MFWKLTHWLVRKYRTGIKPLTRHWCKPPAPGQKKTWVLFGKTGYGNLAGAIILLILFFERYG
ncbi:hypothetical protein OZ248_004404 [Salmonella enterica]|nr:hypothetical protein [Salmonella enterica]EED2887877.1 hypothetical protein [Salmonella enterica subsp. enterica serovar Tanger]EBC1694018.1 hypothetical protein [Salmonella enterica]ECV2983543.1 hypothetical protein [Salmonella enterica]EHK5508904.1 hypothetical protein [Salmonella enterica]